MLKLLAKTAAILLVVTSFTFMVERSQADADVGAAPPGVTSDALCDAAHSEAVSEAAFDTGLLHGSAASDSEGMVVMVDERSWPLMSNAEQHHLAAALDCFVSGPGLHLKGLHFRVNRHGRDLYTLTPSDLMKLRAIGYAAKP